jgi:hypothetical protein
MWDEFTWKVKVLLSRVNYRATFIIGAVILYFGVPFFAPLVMGPRGDLLGLARRTDVGRCRRAAGATSSRQG